MHQLRFLAAGLGVLLLVNTSALADNEVNAVNTQAPGQLQPSQANAASADHGVRVQRSPIFINPFARPVVPSTPFYGSYYYYRQQPYVVEHFYFGNPYYGSFRNPYAGRHRR